MVLSKLPCVFALVRLYVYLEKKLRYYLASDRVLMGFESVLD